jgi:ABC-type multidrug transport system fused ATPase/permease subunit
LEVFLSKKEYNPTELIKNLYPKAEDKIAIEIDNMDFGIIKKREEFVKEEYDESVEKEEDEKYDTNKDKKKDDSDDSDEENEKGIELQDLNFNNKEENNNEIQDKLLLDENKEKDINLKIKENNGKNDDNKSNEEIPEIEIIELLKGINLKIEKGDLIGIVGAVGSGKTCLLNAILNNLDVLNNPEGKKIKINGSIAYVPQKAWIMNETVRNNIVFKRDFNEERYKRVVNICQLIPDFELFKSGDMTQISDKGSNLSGGQKTRITIARAVYSDSDIYLFDDPLSALDSHVGESIFNELMKDYLKSKTILVVTHALQYIPMMNKVIYIDNGKIAFFGKPEDAMELPFFKKALSLEERKKYSELSKKKKKLKAIVMSEYNDTEQENLNSDSLVNKLKTFRRQKSKKKMKKLKK